MKPPNPKQLLHMLERLDWNGHVELGQLDMEWLAASLAAAMHPTKNLCGACGMLREITIQTPLGNICEECLDEAQEEAEETREQLELITKT